MATSRLAVAPIGSDGLQASRLGLGCMGRQHFIQAAGSGTSGCNPTPIALTHAARAGMTFGYKEKGSSVDEQESKRVLERALELGCSFLDTSDVYGWVRVQCMSAVTVRPCVPIKCTDKLTQSHCELTGPTRTRP